MYHDVLLFGLYPLACLHICLTYLYDTCSFTFLIISVVHDEKIDKKTIMIFGLFDYFGNKTFELIYCCLFVKRPVANINMNVQVDHKCYL